mmetsp:Transcript_1397/g.1821  ORF Transcript_1397/g.1821 Transcript_1397/m.1821 type:complete len:162 (+) Transcript_1397:30-515(+)
MQAPNLTLTLFDEENTKTTLHCLRASKPVVIDFWTTKCVRCPACLSKLNEMATKFKGVIFLSICLDDLDFGAELVAENDWDNITHTYASTEVKEIAKSCWGFKSVPFIVVLGPDGATSFSGTGIGFTKEKLQSVLDNDKENVKNVAPNKSQPRVFQIDDDF